MIIFLFGEDNFRSQEKLNEFKVRFLKSASGSTGLSVFEWEGKDLSSGFIETIETSNLLAPQRLIVSKNLIAGSSKEIQEKMLNFLDPKADELANNREVTVIFWEADAPPKNNALFKFLVKKFKSQQFANLEVRKLNDWVKKRIDDIGMAKGISIEALEKLLGFSSLDMFILNSEIEKLSAYASGRSIESEDIEILVKAQVDNNIFETIDAMARGDKKTTLEKIEKHLEEDPDPGYLFSMFLYQFRNLIRIADCKENRGMTNSQLIASETKIHPFVVKKTLPVLARLSLARLKALYARLAEIDFLIKTGKIDSRLAIEKFVLEM